MRDVFKLVNIWQKYGQKLSGTFFTTDSVFCTCCVLDISTVSSAYFLCFSVYLLYFYMYSYVHFTTSADYDKYIFSLIIISVV